MRVWVLWCVLFITLGHGAVASEWTVDQNASTLGFEFRQEGTVYKGAFERFNADIAFDPADPGSAQISVAIDASSVMAGTDERNDALLSKDFFAVKMFPKAAFASTSVRRTGDGAYEMDADLRIRGITQPVTMPFTLEINGDMAHVVAELPIDRLNFDLGQGFWSDADFIGHEVVVKVELYARRVS